MSERCTKVKSKGDMISVDVDLQGWFQEWRCENHFLLEEKTVNFLWFTSCIFGNHRGKSWEDKRFRQFAPFQGTSEEVWCWSIKQT